MLEYQLVILGNSVGKTTDFKAEQLDKELDQLVKLGSSVGKTTGVKAEQL